MTSHIEITREEARQAIALQIAEKHGTSPDVLDRLDISIRTVPIGTSDRMAEVVIAVPKGEAPTQDNICFSVSGIFERSIH